MTGEPSDRRLQLAAVREGASAEAPDLPPLLLIQTSPDASVLIGRERPLEAGGTDGTNSLNTTEMFDPAAETLTFTSGASLDLRRSGMAAAYTQAQDVLVLIGGNSLGPSTEQITTP